MPDLIVFDNLFGSQIFRFAVFMQCHVKIIKLLMGYDHRIKTTSEQKAEALHLADITNQCETFEYLQKIEGFPFKD